MSGKRASQLDVAFDLNSDDSDAELQDALARGDLKPGLNIEIPAQKSHINDTAGMEAKLKEFYLDLNWVERLDMINDPAPAVPGSTDISDTGSGDIAPSGDLKHDDFQRELLFYRQAQAAVLEALPRLRQLGVPTQRPSDYFAEMAKSDVHMKKIREKLLSKEIGMERSEKAKKIRELRKYGKKVQQNVLLQRQKEKREMIESVKKYRKGQIDKLDFLDGDESLPNQQKSRSGKKGGANRGAHRAAKRKYKDEKFGFGGIKKWSKRNTSASSREIRPKREHDGGGQRAKKGNQNKRPGKSARQKMKANRRR